MPDDRTSPSGGWREVYDAMTVEPFAGEDSRTCPDCGRPSANVFSRVYRCSEHGCWVANPA